MKVKSTIIGRIEKIVYIIAVILMFTLVVIVLKLDNISCIQKVVCVTYLIASILLVIFLKIPYISSKLIFKNTSIWAFITWNILISIFVGIILGVFLGSIGMGDTIYLCLNGVPCIMGIVSLVWFVYHIFFKEDNLNILDLYSNIVLTVLTTLSLAVNYSKYKVAFLLIFLFYLLIQIMIKIKIVLNDDGDKQGSN